MGAASPATEEAHRVAPVLGRPAASQMLGQSEVCLGVHERPKRSIDHGLPACLLVPPEADHRLAERINERLLETAKLIQQNEGS
jgi:hypothetical protein